MRRERRERRWRYAAQPWEPTPDRASSLSLSQPSLLSLLARFVSRTRRASILFLFIIQVPAVSPFSLPLSPYGAFFLPSFSFLLPPCPRLPTIRTAPPPLSLSLILSLSLPVSLSPPLSFSLHVSLHSVHSPIAPSRSPRASVLVSVPWSWQNC